MKCVPGTMIVSMIKYFYQILEEFPEVLRSTKPSPSGDNLFTVCDEKDRKVLPEEQPRQFHCTTTQLLFLYKRDKPDIEPMVPFLMTRVKQPAKDNWGKLRHGLIYLEVTLYLKRYLTVDLLSMIQWWVDSSYRVHWDSKGHTGAMMSMCKGGY